MATATVTSKGQITIPKDVRERLGLVEGDIVEFDVDRDGGVRLAPLRGSLQQLRGILPRRPGRAQTLAEIDAATIDAVAADDLRTRTPR